VRFVLSPHAARHVQMMQQMQQPKSPWNVLGWLVVIVVACALACGLGSCFLTGWVATESVNEYDRITSDAVGRSAATAPRD
jgi:hypothetical protein